MLTIWCNARFSRSAQEILQNALGAHRLVSASQLTSSNLAAGAPDPALAEADVALGQPDASSVIKASGLKWVHLTTAGYTRYDTDQFRAALENRQGILTNSSHVYDLPCAEHALAFMLAQARQLPQCLAAQKKQSWFSAEHRANSRLLAGSRVLLLGFGAIAQHLARLLEPFGVTVKALRRKTAGSEAGVAIIDLDQLDEELRAADHVVNILPDNAATRGFMTAARFAEIKPGAIFYNIGRGTTVDQNALLAVLQSGRLRAAYLDVTDPEPLPVDHPLWTAPNCFITPHTAGGFDSEDEALVRHFLANLDRFVVGEELNDRVF